MENPFEKQPLTLAITLGALVLLILGAGALSMYYNGRQALTILPASPYSITWNENFIVTPQSGPQPADIQFSLLNVERTAAAPGSITSTPTLLFTLNALVTVPSSTPETCAWEPPVNVGRIVDEAGTIVRPFINTQETPCLEGRSVLIERKITFPITYNDAEFLFTTGGASNDLFLVSIQADGTLKAELVPQEIPG